MTSLHLSLVACLFFIPGTAEAYLDPGSGSYIIQVTIGMVAGAFFILKNYWAVIKGYFANLFNKENKKK